MEQQEWRGCDVVVLDDILIGAKGNDDGGSGTGKTYLIFSGL